jgi:hypothetical protein
MALVVGMFLKLRSIGLNKSEVEMFLKLRSIEQKNPRLKFESPFKLWYIQKC